MRKINFKTEDIRSIFLENIAGNHEEFIILPASISSKLDRIYNEMFYDLTKAEKFYQKCASFFSHFFIECDELNRTLKQRVSYKSLRTYFSNFKKGSKNYTYKYYLECFSKYELLHKTSSHSDKLSLCAEYKLTNLTIDGNYTIYIFDNKEINAFNVDSQINNLENKFLETLKICKIDIQKYIQIEFDNYVLNNDSAKFFRRINKAIFFNNTKNRTIHYGSKVSRIYHPLCFITRESRNCLNVKFHHLDIVNCQPLLLCYYLKKQELLYDNSFLDDVQNGCLYEIVQNELGVLNVNISRDEVKKEIYSQILFDFKTDEKHIVNKVFKKIYANTYESLKNIHVHKEQTNITLASILQNLESQLFNNLKVNSSEYYFTLFDAIYFSDATDEDELKKQIDSYFEILGLKVTISAK